MHKRKNKNKPKTSNPGAASGQPNPLPIIQSEITAEIQAPATEKVIEASNIGIPITIKEETPNLEAATESGGFKDDISKQTDLPQSNQPQKPKRNRNKKKQQDGPSESKPESIEEKGEDKISTNIIQPIEKSKGTEIHEREVGEKNMEQVTKEQEARVETPSKKKKRNKNKKGGDKDANDVDLESSTQESKAQDILVQKIHEKEETIPEISATDKLLPIPLMVERPETPKVKRKNKNKKGEHKDFEIQKEDQETKNEKSQDKIEEKIVDPKISEIISQTKKFTLESEKEKQNKRDLMEIKQEANQTDMKPHVDADILKSEEEKFKASVKDSVVDLNIAVKSECKKELPVIVEMIHKTPEPKRKNKSHKSNIKKTEGALVGEGLEESIGTLQCERSAEIKDESKQLTGSNTIQNIVEGPSKEIESKQNITTKEEIKETTLPITSFIEHLESTKEDNDETKQASDFLLELLGAKKKNKKSKQSDQMMQGKESIMTCTTPVVVKVETPEQLSQKGEICMQKKDTASTFEHFLEPISSTHIQSINTAEVKIQECLDNVTESKKDTKEIEKSLIEPCKTKIMMNPKHVTENKECSLTHPQSEKSSDEDPKHSSKVTHIKEVKPKSSDDSFDFDMTPITDDVDDVFEMLSVEDRKEDMQKTEEIKKTDQNIVKDKSDIKPDIMRPHHQTTETPIKPSKKNKSKAKKSDCVESSSKVQSVEETMAVPTHSTEPVIVEQTPDNKIGKLDTDITHQFVPDAVFTIPLAAKENLAREKSIEIVEITEIPSETTKSSFSQDLSVKSDALHKSLQVEDIIESRRSRSKEKSPRASVSPRMPRKEVKSNIDSLFPHFKDSGVESDLKSKVFEVNKTMEDLKMSIERSLAELTKVDETRIEEESKIVSAKPAPSEKQFAISINAEIIEEPVERCLRSLEEKTCEKSITSPLSLISEPMKAIVTKEIKDTIKEVTPQPERKEPKNKGKGKGKKLKHPEEIDQSSSTQSNIEGQGVLIPLKENPTDQQESAAKAIEIDTKFDEISKSLIQAEDVTEVNQSKNWERPDSSAATSNKIDYKKEKDKISAPPRKKNKNLQPKESGEIQTIDSDNEEFVYKYSFRKVFIANTCHICKIDVRSRRFECNYCHLVYYCGQKHKDEDWSKHQGFCFAVSTVAHLKGLKYIYSEVKNLTPQDWRVQRMQTIVACEKVMKRKLQPYEQEMLLYPRLCAETSCREWKTNQLSDCVQCGQVTFCAANLLHLPVEHKEWCKSYKLYYELVAYQQNIGRLEPQLPTKVIAQTAYEMPKSIRELFEFLYDAKLSLDEIHYASLTQIATAPLTAAYSMQLYNKKLYNTCSLQNSGQQISTFTLHVVGAEMQFEADVQNKWEIFFLHLYPEIKELKVVFVGPELNPGNLPLDLLAKIKLCKNCKESGRKILFEYEDKFLYHDYVTSMRFTKPDLVCAYNPGLHRSTGYNLIDSWPETIGSILRLNIPFCVTAYTKFELPKDLNRIKEVQAGVKVHLEPTLNPYASVRPDRNFISDDEMPLIFKNYYFMIVSG